MTDSISEADGPEAALDAAHRAGVVVFVEGDRLRCSAPDGAMTAELRDQLRAHKPELIRLLSAPVPPLPESAPDDLRAKWEEMAKIMEHLCDVPRDEAEREAAQNVAVPDAADWPEDARRLWQNHARALTARHGISAAEGAIMAKNDMLRGKLGDVLPKDPWQASLAQHQGSALEAEGLAEMEQAYPAAKPTSCAECGRTDALVMFELDDGRMFCSRCRR